MKTNKISSLLLLSMMLLLLSFGAKAQDHPYYLHALSDLRAARWMIEHRPGNWQSTVDEVEAVKQIDVAINEIKKASIDDRKDIDFHPQVDEHPDRPGRLHDAVEFLRKARQDVNKDEDNVFAQGLRNRAVEHINAAIRATEKAIRQ